MNAQLSLEPRSDAIFRSGFTQKHFRSAKDEKLLDFAQNCFPRIEWFEGTEYVYVAIVQFGSGAEQRCIR
jgi:hypothetical protein